jgi:hypothetical protein
LIFNINRKEAYLWLQGDIHRSKKSNKNNNNNIINNNNNENTVNKNYSDGSLVKCQLLDNDNNTINIIAGEVSGLDLNDESSKLERGRKPRKISTNSSNTSLVEETETQGDQLNRIKAQRRNARSATSGTVTTIPVVIDDPRSHRYKIYN